MNTLDVPKIVTLDLQNITSITQKTGGGGVSGTPPLIQGGFWAIRFSELALCGAYGQIAVIGLTAGGSDAQQCC